MWFGRPFGTLRFLIRGDAGLPGFHFPATVTCPAGGVSQADVAPADWHGAGSWFQTAPNSRFRDPGLLRRVNGEYTDDSVTYRWNLTATDRQP